MFRWSIDFAGPKATTRAGYDWTDYYDLEGLYEWLQSLTRNYPGIVSTFIAGSSHEGREILGAKLSYKEENPKIFIESGIHAREWIAPATATWILNELLTSNNSDVRFMAENFDWYVVPSCNPDGYEYTFTTDRMWRKTRTPGSPCYGVDPNRNWDDRWNQGGASSNPCAQTYAGTGPFSTIETASLAFTIQELKPLVYFCFHSYSQLLMIPYGHRFQNASNYNELMLLGGLAAASLAERYGTEYEVGPIVDVIYVATGGSMDWVKSHVDVKYTFEWELRDTGRYGFLLPPDQIIPTSLETFDSIITILKGVSYQ